MAVVKSKDLQNGTHRLFCSDCESPIDIVTMDCVAWLSNNAIEPFCADCEWTMDDLPPVQVNAQPGEILFIKSPDGNRCDAWLMGEDGLFTDWYIVPTIPEERLSDIVYRISQISNFSVKNGA